MYLLLGIEAAYLIFNYLKLSKRSLIIFSITPGIIFTVAIPLAVKLAHAEQLFGAYKLYAPDANGMQALLWGSYGLIIILLMKPSKEIALALSGIFIFVFSQFYINIGSRPLALFLPFIIASLSRLDEKRLLLARITFLIGLAIWATVFMDPGKVFIHW
jgi:hypothetical protein